MADPEGGVAPATEPTSAPPTEPTALPNTPLQTTEAMEAAPEGEAAEAVEPDEEFEEIEWENGRKYSVPKPLKDAMLRQADYTRKTQEVAERRREVEAQQRHIAEQAEAFKADMAERARMVSYDDALAQYANVDWRAWEKQDFVAAQAGWREYQQLRDARGDLDRKLSEREAQRNLEAQQVAAKRVEEAERTLQRDIKGWSPDVARELRTYGLSQGLEETEVDSIVDPRVIKLLHKAWMYDQSAVKAKSASPQTPPQPLQVIARGKAPAGKPNLAKLEMEAYVAARKAGVKG